MALLPCGAVEDDAPARIDPGDASPTGEHDERPAAPVVDRDLERGAPCAGHDPDACDLAGDLDPRPERRGCDGHGVERLDVEPPGQLLAMQVLARGAQVLDHAAQRHGPTVVIGVGDEDGYGPDPMKTRTLVVLALLCGLALLIAFTVQVLQAR